jgi:hypothetical protein
MSIGKSAIKRVTNNGYSQVKTDAPDMQNSSVIPAPSQEVMDKIITPIEKKTTKKSCKKTSKKATEQSKQGFERVEVGEDLPYYLL